MSIVEYINSRNGNASVSHLTHTKALTNTYGSGEAVKEALMCLVANGILAVYDDGRRVRIA